MKEDPDFGSIVSGETHETAKAADAIGGNTFRMVSAWCKSCNGEDGDHTPNCKKQN